MSVQQHFRSVIYYSCLPASEQVSKFYAPAIMWNNIFSANLTQTNSTDSLFLAFMAFKAILKVCNAQNSE